jgi:hypothetical protein
VAKINISIDDVSPHPLSSTAVLKQCFRVLAEVPTVKFTLFVPAAYWRTIGPTATTDCLRIDAHPGFCDELRRLPTSNFELAYHGLLHGIPGKSNNDELQHLSFDDARKTLQMMIDVVRDAGLADVFRPVLRPPAWRMSPEAFIAAEQVGIRAFALSPDDYAQASYGGAQDDRSVIYYNSCPPQKPLVLSERTEIVYHACVWDKNYLSVERCDELISFLLQNPAEHVFIEGLIG